MASFPSAWTRLRRVVDDAFVPQGFARVDDELLTQPLGAECVTVLRISPSSRKVVGNQIEVAAGVGLNYPRVDGLRQYLWENVVPASPSDLYCPLSCSLSALDRRIPGRSFLLSFAKVDDPSMALLKTVVAEVLANDVQRLSRLDEAVELLLKDAGSPWFNVMSHEDFLPAALLILGRGEEAADVVRKVRSTYGPQYENQARATAYAKFADRVERLVQRVGFAGSPDSRLDVEALARARLH